MKTRKLCTLADILAVMAFVAALAACGNGKTDRIVCDCPEGTTHYEDEPCCEGEDCECEIIPRTYTVSIGTLSNGTITADPTSGNEGTEITLTVTPEAAYRLKPNTLKHGTTPIDETSKKFNLPAENITVTAEFELIPLCECDPKAHLGIDEDCACGGSGCDCTLEPVTLSNGVTKVYAVGVDKTQLDTAVAMLNQILAGTDINQKQKENFKTKITRVDVKPDGTAISYSGTTLTIAHNSTYIQTGTYLLSNNILAQLLPPHALRLAGLKIDLRVQYC